MRYSLNVVWRDFGSSLEAVTVSFLSYDFYRSHECAHIEYVISTSGYASKLYSMQRRGLLNLMILQYSCK